MISWSVTAFFKINHYKAQAKDRLLMKEASVSVPYSHQTMIIKHDLKFGITELKETLKFHLVHLHALRQGVVFLINVS